MAEKNSLFFLYFIGINENGIMNTVLCSVYHKELILGTVKQFLWAGRNSRGVTQFVGEELDKILREKDFKNNIDESVAKEFIDNLIG